MFGGKREREIERVKQSQRLSRESCKLAHRWGWYEFDRLWHWLVPEISKRKEKAFVPENVLKTGARRDKEKQLRSTLNLHSVCVCVAQ